MLALRPYRPVRLATAMDRLFDEFLARPFPEVENHYALPVDVQEHGDEYVLTASTPGLKADDLSAEVRGDTLTIRGEVQSGKDEQENGYLLRERRYGKFARTLTLPAELDGAKAEAALENGVLTLRVPKAETARARVIKIKAK